MLFQITLAALLAAVSAQPLSAIKRGDIGSGPQGWGVTHSGTSDLEVAFGTDGECLDVFTGAMKSIPNQQTLNWDQPVANVKFNWVAFMSSGKGTLDISTGDNCETFVQQLTGDALMAGTCFATAGTCLHYWTV